MEPYYYQRLNKAGQAAYHAMMTGLQNLAPSFSVPLLDGKDLADIYFCLRMDHPELFYSVTYKYRYYKDAQNAELIPDYLFDKKKILDHQKAMKNRVEKLARPMQGKKDREKLQYIHDFICTSIHYDKLKKAYSHEIIGPLGQGVGVCEGIAKSVKVLCDALGIWCIVAICGNNPEKGIKYRHMWNIVRVDGVYYHLDATFDNTLGRSDEIRYDYFLLNDKQIFRDHEPLIYPVPACPDGDHFYYKEARLSFTKEEDVRKRVMQAAKKGKVFLFHWRGGYLTREILGEFLKMFEEEAAKKEKHALVSINWPQAVIRVSFEKDMPTQQVILEEANEGEQVEGEKSEAEKSEAE